MACQKECIQGRNDIIVKVNLPSPIPTSCIIPTLSEYFLACHPYILLYFQCFFKSCEYMYKNVHFETTTHNLVDFPRPSCCPVFNHLQCEIVSRSRESLVH